MFQPSVLSRSAIILDLTRTNDRTSDFAQLKEKINGALSQCEERKGVHCTGLQRRFGGEDQIKITFATEEAARTARQHSQWLQEPRFCVKHVQGRGVDTHSESRGQRIVTHTVPI